MAPSVQFVEVIVVLFVLGGPMVVFSIILREVIPHDGPPPSSLLLPAAAFAYYIARSWARFVETTAGFAFHTIHCRLLTTACLFSTTVVHLPLATAMLLALFVYIVCPHSLLWVPVSKRPAALPKPNSKRPRQQQVDYGPWCNDLAKNRGEPAATSQKGRCKTERRREDHDCKHLAAELTALANTKISSVAASTEGLSQRGCGFPF